MSTVQDLFLENLKRMGLLDESPAPPAVQPARRVEQQAPAPAKVVTPAPIVAKPAIVQDGKVTDLERRVKVLEDLLRPALGKKPLGEVQQIEIDYALLVSKGTDLNFHQFRTLPRLKRKALLQEAA